MFPPGRAARAPGSRQQRRNRNEKLAPSWGVFFAPATPVKRRRTALNARRRRVRGWAPMRSLAPSRSTQPVYRIKRRGTNAGRARTRAGAFLFNLVTFPPKIGANPEITPEYYLIPLYFILFIAEYCTKYFEYLFSSRNGDLLAGLGVQFKSIETNNKLNWACSVILC